MPDELCRKSGPEERGCPKGPKDGGEAPELPYESARLKVRQRKGVQAGRRGEGVDEEWWNGVCLGSREEPGSGEEWARGVQDEGRDSVVCCGKKKGYDWGS